jgi:hypothetical protein
MLKSFRIFKRNAAHLEEKKHLKEIRIVHSQGLNALNMQIFNFFSSKFEHISFSINKKYFKKFMTIQTIMFHLRYFKHIKM